jgi:hypothetical protein
MSNEVNQFMTYCSNEDRAGYTDDLKVQANIDTLLDDLDGWKEQVDTYSRRDDRFVDKPLKRNRGDYQYAK